MLALVAGLSTGHKIGLLVVGAVFIGFALSASFLAPRRWPDFPGHHGMSVFILASFVLFFGMLAAVYVFGKESEAENAAAAQGHVGKPANQTIKVTEREFRIQLPPLKELAQGTYTFDVHNAGQAAHNLVVEGGRASGPQSTPLIQPGADAKLTVSLGRGNYTLYCSVDGHRKLGMQAQISVG